MEFSVYLGLKDIKMHKKNEKSECMEFKEAEVLAGWSRRDGSRDGEEGAGLWRAGTFRIKRNGKAPPGEDVHIRKTWKY